MKYLEEEQDIDTEFSDTDLFHNHFKFGKKHLECAAIQRRTMKSTELILLSVDNMKHNRVGPSVQQYRQLQLYSQFVSGHLLICLQDSRT